MARRPARRQPRQPHSPRASADAALQDTALVATIRSALRASTPHALLDWAAMTIEMLAPPTSACTDPSHGHPVHVRRPGSPTLAGLVESFVEVPCAETTAALRVMQALTTDDDVRALAVRGLATRRHPMPLWLAHLDEARAVTDVVKVTDDHGDQTTWVIGVRLVGGTEISWMIRTDANLGGAIIDAYPADRTVRQAMSVVVDALTEGLHVVAADGAEARAAIEHGLDMSDDVTVADADPTDRDTTWPHVRPAVRWAASLLPEGGAVPSYTTWDDDQREAYLDALLSSPELAAEMSRAPDRTTFLARLALDASLDLLGDDPDRWSPEKLERLLLDLVPGKVLAPTDGLLELVGVMAAWVEHSARVRDLAPGVVRELRSALATLAPAFEAALDDAAAHPSPVVQMLLEATGLESVDDLARLSPETLDALHQMLPLPGTPAARHVEEYRNAMAYLLAEAVGGIDAIRGLTTEPLPDEPFDPAGIAADVLPRIERWLDLAEDVLTQLHPDDVELRTSLRRTTAAIAARNPEFLRRKSDDARGAAALLLLVLRGNGRFGWGVPMTQKELAERFGVQGSVTQRQEPMLRALDLTPAAAEMGLGSPRLLTSHQRAALVKDWDEFG